MALSEQHIVLMGVSGVGKSAVGRVLAQDMGRPFIEGDDYHPPANIAAMMAGRALTDVDRDAWVEALCEAANAAHASVIACSALNGTVRGWLTERSTRALVFVHLTAPLELLRERLAARSGHFFGPALLDSQIAALDRPADALNIPSCASPTQTAQAIRDALTVAHKPQACPKVRHP